MPVSTREDAGVSPSATYATRAYQDGVGRVDRLALRRRGDVDLSALGHYRTTGARSATRNLIVQPQVG
jgi:hypothetical protein